MIKRITIPEMKTVSPRPSRKPVTVQDGLRFWGDKVDVV
jgi:hypothetical protein